MPEGCAGALPRCWGPVRSPGLRPQLGPRPDRHTQATCAILEELGSAEVLPSVLTNRWKGSLRMSRSVDFWYFRISRSATVPGRYRCGSARQHQQALQLRVLRRRLSAELCWPSLDELAVDPRAASRGPLAEEQPHSWVPRLAPWTWLGSF